MAVSWLWIFLKGQSGWNLPLLMRVIILLSGRIKDSLYGPVNPVKAKWAALIMAGLSESHMLRLTTREPTSCLITLGQPSPVIQWRSTVSSNLNLHLRITSLTLHISSLFFVCLFVFYSQQRYHWAYRRWKTDHTTARTQDEWCHASLLWQLFICHPSGGWSSCGQESPRLH